MTDFALSEINRGPFAPCPAPFNMAAHVLARAGAQPDKIALSVMQLSGSSRWSYARLEAAVRGTGTGLLQLGLEPGDTLLLRLGNTVDFPIAYLGAIAVGIVPVPTSSQLTLPEVEAMIETLQPAAVAVDAGLACPGSSDFMRIDAPALANMRELPPADYAMGDPGRLAYIVYTSGTSGRPRAVMHAHRAIWARQMMMTGWYDLRTSDRLCHAGAFNWTYTLGTGLMDPWTMGATALIPEAGIAPERLPLLMKRFDATIFAAAPGVYRKVLKQGSQLSLPKLRHGLSAGEKLGETVRKDWRAATGTELYEAYGMSECSTFISSCPASPALAGALGTPQHGRHIALLGADGAPVPLGEIGEISVHESDPGLMLGYLGAEEETRARFSGPWFRTGDLGHADAEGHVFYHARRDDMMNAGGYRVSPLEVETALHGLEGLTALAVTDIEIKEDVRIIACFYVGEVSEDALKARADAQLAAYKRPKLYRRLDALPTGPNGKLKRAELRASAP